MWLLKIRGCVLAALGATAAAAAPFSAVASSVPSLQQVLEFWSESRVVFAFPAGSQSTHFDAKILLSRGRGTWAAAFASRDDRRYRTLFIAPGVAAYSSFGGARGGPAKSRGAGFVGSPAAPDGGNYFTVVFNAHARRLRAMNTESAATFIFYQYHGVDHRASTYLGLRDEPGGNACTIRLGPRLFGFASRKARSLHYDSRDGVLSIRRTRHGGVATLRIKFALAAGFAGAEKVFPAAIDYAFPASKGRPAGHAQMFLDWDPATTMLPARHCRGQARLAGISVRMTSPARFHAWFKAAASSKAPITAAAKARERRFILWAAGKKLGQRIVRWVNGGPWKPSSAPASVGVAK